MVASMMARRSGDEPQGGPVWGSPVQGCGGTASRRAGPAPDGGGGGTVGSVARNLPQRCLSAIFEN